MFPVTLAVVMIVIGVATLVTAALRFTEPFAISQPAISRHIRVLSEAGLIVQRVAGTKRPCRLAPGALSELDDYLEMLREALSRNYRRLDQLLAKQAKRKDKSR